MTNYYNNLISLQVESVLFSWRMFFIWIPRKKAVRVQGSVANSPSSDLIFRWLIKIINQKKIVNIVESIEENQKELEKVENLAKRQQKKPAKSVGKSTKSKMDRVAIAHTQDTKVCIRGRAHSLPNVCARFLTFAKTFNT